LDLSINLFGASGPERIPGTEVLNYSVRWVRLHLLKQVVSFPF